jgi:hypothetical protein
MEHCAHELARISLRGHSTAILLHMRFTVFGLLLCLLAITPGTGAARQRQPNIGLPHSNDMNPTPAAPKNATSRLDQQADWWAAPLFRNEELIECPADQTTLTRRYTREAIQFIAEHKRGPFFMYLAHTFPHVPLFASQQFSRASARGLYGDVVEELDWSVGQVLGALRREGLAKNTLVSRSLRHGPQSAPRVLQLETVVPETKKK